MHPLAPLGVIYGRILDARNRMFDRGILRSYALGARTVSIGNLTTGGTGKTPLVALTARILANSGENVCILTRGYGRENENERVLISDGEAVLADAAKGGDEPVELARNLIGKAVVVADADRLSAGRWAKERFGITAFVLDDGFQHRRVERDLDIVCIDAMQGLGRMLPAGRMREPAEALKRADMVVITRADMIASIEDLRSEISDLAPTASVFRAETLIADVTPLQEYISGQERQASGGTIEKVWERIRTENPASEPVRLLAFCALGNPENFFLLLQGTFEDEESGEFDLGVMRSFPDHHAYTQADIDTLHNQARECMVTAFLTTAKDAVKLKGLKFELPCYVVEIEPVVDRPEDFRRLITSF